MLLVLLWIVAIGLAVYVNRSAADVRETRLCPLLVCVHSSPLPAPQAQPFDPFEILSVERGATEREIKKAYRQLSLKYHPDKVTSRSSPSPRASPRAHAFFPHECADCSRRLTRLLLGCPFLLRTLTQKRTNTSRSISLQRTRRGRKDPARKTCQCTAQLLSVVGYNGTAAVEPRRGTQALTDETARENLAKFGHPDGPQGTRACPHSCTRCVVHVFATLPPPRSRLRLTHLSHGTGMQVGVALPSFLFENGKFAPLMLAAIVGARPGPETRRKRPPRGKGGGAGGGRRGRTTSRSPVASLPACRRCGHSAAPGRCSLLHHKHHQI